MSSITKEIAESEFARFLEAMDLTDKVSDFEDEKEQKDFEDLKQTVLRAMLRDTLVIDQFGQPVFTPVDPDLKGLSLTFHEPTGGDIMAMDVAREQAKAERTNRLLAAVTKSEPKTFAKMKHRDYEVCTALLTLFFV